MPQVTLVNKRFRSSPILPQGMWNHWLQGSEKEALTYSDYDYTMLYHHKGAAVPKPRFIDFFFSTDWALPASWQELQKLLPSTMKAAVKMVKNPTSATSTIWRPSWSLRQNLRFVEVCSLHRRLHCGLHASFVGDLYVEEWAGPWENR